MFKPKYAPELEELFRIPDGSLDDTPYHVELTKSQFAENFQRRQNEWETNRSKPSIQDKRRMAQSTSHSTNKKGAFASLMSEMRSIYEEVKKELEV